MYNNKQNKSTLTADKVLNNNSNNDNYMLNNNNCQSINDIKISNLKNIPEELKDNDNWVVVKENKIPYQINKKKAQSDNSKTWNTYSNCLNAMNNNSNIRGLGYMLSIENDYVILDIDKVDINKEEKMKIINKYDTYTELSQSGKGYHLIFKTDKKGFEKYAKDVNLIGYNNGTKNTLSAKQGDFEIYIEKRYFWLTGDVINNKSKIKHIDFEELEEIYEFINNKKPSIILGDTSKNHTINFNMSSEEILKYLEENGIKTSPKLTNEEVLKKCRNAKNKDKFLKLYNKKGDLGDSEDNQALINILLFYTQDIEQICDIMKKSPTNREKFNRDDYLKRTIINGLQLLCSNGKLYQPEFSPDFNNEVHQNTSNFDEIIDILHKINVFKGEKSINKGLSYDVSCEHYDIPKTWGHGYYMNKHGFVKRTIIEGKKDELDTYIDKLITPLIIIPNRIIKVDRQEELELKGILNKKEKIMITENDTFSSSTKIKTFLNSYFKIGAWFDGNIRDITCLEKFISTYKNFIKLIPVNAVSKLGWTKNNEFNPYSPDELFIKDTDIHSLNFAKCFIKKGNYETWKKYITKYSKNDTFRLLFNTSLSSPLISLIRRPSIWVHNFEKADSGKTPGLFAAASIWAKPGKDGYTPSFNITRVGLEFMLHTLGNLPCILDDSQNLDSRMKEKIVDVIYDVFNGSGRLRGSIKGTNQQNKFWNLSMITNGESELLQGSEFEGTSKRLIEWKGKPFNNIEDAIEARDIFQDNYGFYGEEYIKTISNNIQNLKKLCITIENKIRNNINLSTHIQNISTLIVCDYIFNVYCLGNDKKQSIDNAIIWGLRILEKLPKNNDVDKVTKGIELVKEYIISNSYRFYENCPQGQIGFTKDNNVYFFINSFNKLLKEWGIPNKRFIDEIKCLDITDTDKNGYFKRILYKGRRCRYVCFKNFNLETNF